MYFLYIFIYFRNRFIDTNCIEVVECKYDWIDDFYEGFAKVKLNGKFGFIDENGVEVVSWCYNPDKAELQFEKYKLNLDRKNKIKNILS